MKIILKIILIVVGILFFGGLVLGIIADIHDGNRQFFRLYNTSNESKSTTFESFSNDGTLSKEWSVDKIVNPGEQITATVLPGKYLVKVWNQKDSLDNQFEFNLENPDESNYNLYRFDLAMDKEFFLVNKNAMYDGNSLSNTIATALGTKQQSVVYEAFYEGNRPFLIPEVYSKSTFIDLDEELPDRKKIGETIYQLQIVE